jgi:hypothetical protein
MEFVMSPSKETTGGAGFSGSSSTNTVVPFPVIPRFGTPIGLVPKRLCLGTERVIKEAWAASAAARTSASQVPDDADTQDYCKRTISALAQLSATILSDALDYDVRSAAFSVLGFARETQENAFAAGMTSMVR